MKKNTLNILFFFSLLLIITVVNAQLTGCPSNTMYLHYGNGGIGQIDLTNNAHSMNTISTPAGGSGLAFGDVNGFTPSPTFFTVVSGIIYYYNGTTWVSTGHSSGNVSAVNLTAGGGYLFLLDGLGGRIYRYDGTGNSVQILTVPTSPGPFDLASDIDGNFYFLRTSAAPYQLTKYSPTGAVLCTWSVTGMNGLSSGGGFGFIGDRLYAEAGGTLYTGVFTATSVNFTSSPVPGGISSSDMASCPLVTPITSFVSATSLSCSFGSLDVTVSPPNILPATYQWSGPSIIGASNVQTITVGQPGVYTVVVTPLAGCPITKTINVPGPSIPTVSAVMTQMVECTGQAGAAMATTTGGSGPITYQWSNGATTPAISNLTVGSYVVTVTDSVGCTAVDTVDVLGDSSLLVATINPTHLTCFGGNDGSAAVAISLGEAPFTYLWSNGTSAGNATNLTVGTYSVLIRDATGCEITLQTTLTEPDALTAFANNTPSEICVGDSAYISGGAQGGVGGFTYNWAHNNSSTLNQIVTPTATTTYQLTALDANGCTVSATTTVSVNPLPDADFSVDNYIVNLDFPAVEMTLLTGGLSSWSWQVDGLTFLNESSIRYEFADIGIHCILLDVTSLQGCRDTVSRCVEVVPGYSFYIPNSFSPDEDKLNDVFIPKGNGIIDFKMEIFTRWGEKLFESIDFLVGWNGIDAYSNKPLPQGVYVYKIYVLDRFNKEYDYMGNVNLFR